VGDVHQPLHCATRVSAAKPDGDDGGNGVTLSASPGKLHSFWDGVLGGGDSPVTARTAALSLTAAPAPAADDLDIQHWIDESFNAAKSTVYKNPPIGRTIYSDSDVQDGGADSRRKAHCSRRGAPREDS
jgi:hypothetical protein